MSVYIQPTSAKRSLLILPAYRSTQRPPSPKQRQTIHLIWHSTGVSGDSTCAGCVIHVWSAADNAGRLCVFAISFGAHKLKTTIIMCLAICGRGRGVVRVRERKREENSSGRQFHTLRQREASFVFDRMGAVMVGVCVELSIVSLSTSLHLAWIMSQEWNGAQEQEQRHSQGRVHGVQRQRQHLISLDIVRVGFLMLPYAQPPPRHRVGEL